MMFLLTKVKYKTNMGLFTVKWKGSKHLQWMTYSETSHYLKKNTWSKDTLY